MKRYDDTRREILKDPREAAEYLNTVLEQENMEMFMAALRNVVEAQGGMMKVSKKTHLNRGHLYKMLSKHGNPEIQSLEALLEAFGVKLFVGIKDKRLLKKAA